MKQYKTMKYISIGCGRKTLGFRLIKLVDGVKCVYQHMGTINQKFSRLILISGLEYECNNIDYQIYMYNMKEFNKFIYIRKVSGLDGSDINNNDREKVQEFFDALGSITYNGLTYVYY